MIKDHKDKELKAKIIKESNEYEFSFYKKGEIYIISYEFDKIFIGTKKEKGSITYHAKAIKKSDCKLITNENDHNKEQEN